MAVSTISIGNVFPSLGGLAGGGVTARSAAKSILDFVFTDCAIIMTQPSKLWGGSGNTLLDTTGFPLLGFSFQTPDMISFCKYSYGEYPFLNRAVVANAFYKEPCEVEVVGLRPIQRTNPVIANYALNKAGVKYYIEKYADNGGIWAINTLWGYYSDLVLESLDGVKVEGSELGGIGFKFTFRRLNFSSIESSTISLSNSVASLAAL